MIDRNDNLIGEGAWRAGLAFVLPVKSPANGTSNDYRVVENLLRASVESTLRQTRPDILIVVCCHVIPDWADSCDRRVHFLDVSLQGGISGEQERIVDIGRKRLLGALYAWQMSRPDYLVMSDADDYVRVDLGERLMTMPPAGGSSDGYRIVRGAETQVRLDRALSVRYNFAIEVGGFDVLCGTSRIFRTDSIVSRVRSEFPKGFFSFTEWCEDSTSRIRAVPRSVLEAFSTEAAAGRRGAHELVQVLGRHVRQAPYFDLEQLDFVGAAKACGHGNHAGPNLGRVHWQREIRPIPLQDFRTTFGLPAGSGSRIEWLHLFKARLGHRAAFRSWLSRTRSGRLLLGFARRLPRWHGL